MIHETPIISFRSMCILDTCGYTLMMRTCLAYSLNYGLIHNYRYPYFFWSRIQKMSKISYGGGGGIKKRSNWWPFSQGEKYFFFIGGIPFLLLASPKDPPLNRWLNSSSRVVGLSSQQPLLATFDKFLAIRGRRLIQFSPWSPPRPLSRR